MRIFLLFLVSLFSSFSAFAGANGSDTVPTTGELTRYAFEITTPKAALTGIMLVKETDEVIMGSMVNEFGVSAIDFIYQKGKDKLKLQNVISFLNKWYIKMALKKDIRLALHVLFDMPYKTDNNYEITKSDNGYIIKNKKRNLIYTFNTILVTESGYDTEE